MLMVFPINSFAQVRISGLNDFSFGSWNGVQGLSLSDELCIWSPRSNSIFISAFGNGLNNSFQLRGALTNINYEIKLKINQGSYVELLPNKFTPFVSPGDSSPNCFGGSNAELQITIPQSSLEDVEEGFYYGQIVIMVTP